MTSFGTLLREFSPRTSARTAWQIFQLGCFTVWYSLFGLSFSWFDKDYRLFYKHGLRFAQRILRIARITVNVEGRENLDANSTFVFVANHASLFDIPALWVALGEHIRGGRVRIVYKRELEFIPIFGWELKMCPFIAIERGRARSSMASLERAAEAVAHGDSVIIFAEGTRSRSGRLQEFKRGAFLLASRSKKPLVPVSIIGSQHIMRAGSWDFHPGTIRVVIGKPVVQDEAGLSDKVLMQRLFHTIANTLPEEQQPLTKTD